jgi:AcrR family transcriptional regulator
MMTTVTATATEQTTRMTSAQRREQILAAARRVFAESGYAATTDEVARAAGVSQPYVVRLFGSKRELFLATYQQASLAVVAALASAREGLGPEEAKDAMGKAYLELIEDRDLLRLMMHGFIAGADEEVGRIARHCLGEAFRLFRERTGAGEEEARQFVAFGMLLNVLVALDAPSHRGEDAGMDGLLDCVFLAAHERRTA